MRLDNTCDQDPGAAQRSTTFLTFFRMSNESSICSSLNADRARHPSSLAFLYYMSLLSFEAFPISRSR